jgi:hypothetical protein
LRTFRQFQPTAVLSALLASTLSVFRTRAALQLEIIALRHQLGVLQLWFSENPRTWRINYIQPSSEQR